MEMIGNDHPWADIWQKVKVGERLTREEGKRLLATNDLLTLGYMAHYVQEQKHGNRAYLCLQEESSSADIMDADPEFLQLTAEQQLDYLLHVRELQDRKGTYRTFLLTGIPNQEMTGYQMMRIVAITRLILDNMEHVCLLARPGDEKEIQTALFFGVDEWLIDADGEAEGKQISEWKRQLRQAGKVLAERVSMHE